MRAALMKRIRERHTHRHDPAFYEHGSLCAGSGPSGPLKHKIKGKLAGRGGFSLSEMLTATLILLLVSGILTATASLAMGHFQKSTRSSEANVLASTLKSVFLSELAYTTEVQTDHSGSDGISGNVLKFQSQNYSIEGAISSVGVSDPDAGGYGKIVFYNADDPSESLKVLGDGSYPNGIGARVEQLTYDAANQDFTLTLEIGYQDTVFVDRTMVIHNENGEIAEGSDADR